MKKYRKIIAILIAMLLFLTVLFSCIFIIEYVHHDCPGENCSVCMEMNAAMQIISGFKMLPVGALILVMVCIFTHLCMSVFEVFQRKDTLITLKVELLD